MQNYEQFLAERRKRIASAINDFLDELIEDKITEPIDEQVKLLIAAGETQFVEFKSSMRWDYKAQSANKALQLVIVKTISGFMNAKGGTLLVGIGPAGEVSGY